MPDADLGKLYYDSVMKHLEACEGANLAVVCWELAAEVVRLKAQLSLSSEKATHYESMTASYKAMAEDYKELLDLVVP